MKKLSLSILTIFAMLMAMPLMAQTVDTERTNPDAPSIAPHSGMTLTGTVTSWNDQEIVLETETGVEHIVLTGDVTVPAGIAEGDTVTVDYTRNSQGTMIAKEIRLMGEAETDVMAQGEVDTTATTDMGADATVDAQVDTTMGTESDVDYGTETDVDVTADADLDVQDTEVQADADVGFDDDFATDDELDSELDDELPATATQEPLLLVLGVVGLAGAAGLRYLS